jgi:hypothetical protein
MMVLLEWVGTGPVASFLGSIALVIPSPVGGILLSPPTPSAPSHPVLSFPGTGCKGSGAFGGLPLNMPGFRGTALYMFAFLVCPWVFAPHIFRVAVTSGSSPASAGSDGFERGVMICLVMLVDATVCPACSGSAQGALHVRLGNPQWDG